MALTPYARTFLQLLPQGRAWDKSLESTLAKLVQALADSAELDEETAKQLLIERWPTESNLLLADWEAWLGLPDCTSEGMTIAVRRAAAAAKMKMVGSLNRFFYIDLAAQYGYDIDLQPTDDGVYATVLDDCLTPIRKRRARWVTNVIVKNDVGYRNATVLDNCKTRLRVYDSGVLVCLLEKYKPAHQVFNYIYQD